MAVPGGTVWEVRTAGNDTNGGGFVAGASGSDYSQQDNKNTVGSDISTTDGVANGTTTFTSATANFGTTIVGNIVYIAGGSGAIAAGWYHVSARASTTSITLDRAISASTGMTLNIGGALASMGAAGISAQSGNTIYIKSGTYLITTNSGNVANGCLSKSSTDVSVLGYGSSRNDYGTKPILRASAITTFTLIATGQSNTRVENLSLDGADAVASRGVNLSGGLLFKCYAEDFSNSAFFSSNFVTAIQCEATSCTGTALFSGIACVDCIARDSSFTGFGGNVQKYTRCIAYNLSGGSTDGFNFGTSDGILTNCVAYNCGRDGFRQVSGAQNLFEDCVAEGNAGIGFDLVNTTNVIMINCAGYNNTGGNTSFGTARNQLNSGFVTGSSSFFTNPGSGDFSLNNTAGGGAALKGTGYPGAMPGGLTTGYLDIGVAQSQAAAASGAVSFV